MSDPTGLQGALAVEAVEWAPGHDDRLTVTVRGRWRRRRGDWRGQPVLTIEAEGQRHRFQAIPEPPSIGGAPPGGWVMTFSVPAWLAPHLGGRIWLQLGLAVIPLPRPSGPPVGESEAGAAARGSGALPAADDETLSERRARTAELAAETARNRAADAEAAVSELLIRVEELEQELDQARQEPDRLRREIATRDRQRRSAEQRAYAEYALRIELEEELARDDDERDERGQASRIEAGELAAAEARIRELEDELADAERRADEAERIAQGLRRAEAVVAEAPPALPAPPAPVEMPSLPEPPSVVEISAPGSRAFDLGPEIAVAAATLAARKVEVVAPVAPAPPPASAVGSEPVSGPTGDELAAVLAELRTELEELAAVAEREYAAGEASRARVDELERRVDELETDLGERDARAGRAFDGLQELRDLLGRFRVADGPLAEPAAGLSEPPAKEAASVPASIELERFDAALRRLRAERPELAEGDAESEPELRPAPARGGVRPWLAPAFARLAKRDPDAAGRLLVGLLPAQRAAYAAPAAYDLVLGPDSCIQVTVGEQPGRPEIAVTNSPRDLSTVSFRAVGGHAELARLITAGPIRRRFGRRVARVEGDRSGVAVLTALTRAPLSLIELYEAGVRLAPELAFMLAAAMIEPAWTAEHRFSIGHESDTDGGSETYLNIRRGGLATVTDSPPLGPVATTIGCSDEAVLAVLGGDSDTGAEVRGEPGPLLSVLGWLERAQR